MPMQGCYLNEALFLFCSNIPIQLYKARAPGALIIQTIE